MDSRILIHTIKIHEYSLSTRWVNYTSLQEGRKWWRKQDKSRGQHTNQERFSERFKALSPGATLTTKSLIWSWCLVTLFLSRTTNDMRRRMWETHWEWSGEEKLYVKAETCSYHRAQKVLDLQLLQGLAATMAIRKGEREISEQSYSYITHRRRGRMWGHWYNAIAQSWPGLKYDFSIIMTPATPLAAPPFWWILPISLRIMSANPCLCVQPPSDLSWMPRQGSMHHLSRSTWRRCVSTESNMWLFWSFFEHNDLRRGDNGWDPGLCAKKNTGLIPHGYSKSPSGDPYIIQCLVKS